MLTAETLPYCRGDHFALRHARWERPGMWLRDGTADLGEWRETMHMLGSRDLRGWNTVDVGAGVGTFAAMAAHQGSRQVLAIEPEECRLKTVARQARDLPQIRPLRAALGEEMITKSMKWPVEGVVTTQHAIAHLTLDSLSYVRPDLLKISTLGAGVNAFKLIPATVRLMMIKTLPLSMESLARIQHFSRGLQLVDRNPVKFDHTPRVWYIWEKF